MARFESWIPSHSYAAHSSSGPGHLPLKEEITGSNPVCATIWVFNFNHRACQDESPIMPSNKAMCYSPDINFPNTPLHIPPLKKWYSKELSWYRLETEPADTKSPDHQHNGKALSQELNTYCTESHSSETDPRIYSSPPVSNVFQQDTATVNIA